MWPLSQWCGPWHCDAALASVALASVALGGAALGGAALGTVVQLSAAVSPSVVRLFAAMLLLMTVGAAL